MPKNLTDTLQTCFRVWRFFYVLFSGSNLSAHATQSLSIHSISGIGRKPVKKIPAHATLLLTMKPEVESPFNRICISYNRRGQSAFAVFLLAVCLGQLTITRIKACTSNIRVFISMFRVLYWNIRSYPAMPVGMEAPDIPTPSQSLMISRSLWIRYSPIPYMKRV